jgi:ATP-dependent DNA helicase RecQ
MNQVRKKPAAKVPAEKEKKIAKSVSAKSSAKDNLHEALQHYFGFDAFKGTQEAVINNLLSGKDTFVIMPTGGGKSLCYQLPAMVSEGVAIIVSPLIALMKNQVDLVRSYSSNDNVAHFLNSTLSKKEIKEVQTDLSDGHTKMLYVAPETLTKEENIDFFSSLKISFFEKLLPKTPKSYDIFHLTFLIRKSDANLPGEVKSNFMQNYVKLINTIQSSQITVGSSRCLS